LISFKSNRGYYIQSNNDKIKYSNSILNDFYFEKKLGPYLAGLIEGDGHIYVPSTIRNAKGKKIAPSIEIAFDIKDYPLFEKIKDTLEGGYIVLRKNNKSGRLIIKKKNVLLKLINLINGYIWTPKIEAIHRLIDWCNNENDNYQIQKLELDVSSIDKNSWLSGFIEADDSFYLKWNENEKSKSMPLRPIYFIYYLRLSQRQFYTRIIDPNISESNFKIMDEIAKYLHTIVISVYRKINKYEEKGYLIRTDKLESKEKMFSYFNNYPLFGYKYFAQINLANIHDLIKNSQHKTEKGKLKLIKYTNLMKYEFIRDTWDHLNKFYKI